MRLFSLQKTIAMSFEPKRRDLGYQSVHQNFWDGCIGVNPVRIYGSEQLPVGRRDFSLDYRNDRRKTASPNAGTGRKDSIQQLEWCESRVNQICDPDLPWSRDNGQVAIAMVECSHSEMIRSAESIVNWQFPGQST